MPIHLPPLNRRRFLSCTLAAGAAAFLPQSAWAAPDADPNRFALLSDIHIPAERARTLHDVAPCKNLAQALEMILRDPARPAGAMVSGDCAFLKGRADDYVMLKELLQPARKAGLPVHLALGNHDGRAHVRKAFPELNAATVRQPLTAEKFISVVETPHADWYLLDSLDQTDVTPGVLGEQQLQWLAQTLDARPEKPALLLAHHNPHKPGQNALTDTAAFYKVIMPRKQVKAYFFGHTHCWNIERQDKLHLVNLPATAWLFNQADPRGYVMAQLRAGGATLKLHTLDGKHRKEGETIDLTWRT